jgi:hypothetical protein
VNSIIPETIEGELRVHDELAVDGDGSPKTSRVLVDELRNHVPAPATA